MTHSCFSSTVHQRTSTQNDLTVGVQNPRFYLSGSVAPQHNSPNLNLVDYKLWGSCNSGSIRWHSRMWMNSRSDWLKSGLVWSRTLLTPLSMHGETVRMLVFVQRADISNIDCSSWTTGHLDKLSARVTENVNQMWSTRVILIKWQYCLV